MVPRTNQNTWKRKKWDNVVDIDVKYLDRQRMHPQICIWRRTNAGKTMVIDPDIFPSYFYIPVNDIGHIESLQKELIPNSVEYPEIKALDGTDVVKLVYEKFNKDQFRNARDHFPKTFEDDVKYIWRYLLDNDVTFTTSRRICFFDIENDMSIDIVNAPAKVLSITLHDNFTETTCVLVLDETLTNMTSTKRVDEKNFIVRYKRESGLLNGFIRFIQIYNPDILCAYNLMNFDFPYLINRMKKLDIDSRGMSETRNVYAIIDDKGDYDPKCYCGGRELMDWYILMKKLYDEDKPDDYKLDTVGEKLLNMKKVTHGYRDVGELYRKDPALFMEYNKQDVIILKELEKKVGLIQNYMLSLQQLIPMPLEQLKNNSMAWDFRILKKYNGKIIFPSKRNREHKRFKGALTGRFIEDEKGIVRSANPEKRLFENIGVLDFSGMYPNIFRTFNVSPDTICIPGEPNSVTLEGNAFTQDMVGILPRLVQEIMDLRKIYTEQMNNVDPNTPEYALYYNLQYGVKRLNNSLYGATGYSGFRLFDLRVAESITLFGQKLITAVYKFLKHDLGYETIYQDTDSVFIPLKSKIDDKIAVEEEIAMIEEKVNTMIEDMVTRMGVQKNYMKMDFEKRFTKVIFLGVKKRYIGKADLWKGKWLKEPKIVIKGYDIARRELPMFARNILKSILNKFLDVTPTSEIKTFYQKTIKDLKEHDLHEIAITRALGKNIDQYEKTLPQHVKACIAGEQYFGLKFRKGDQVKIMYVKDLPYINNRGSSGTTDVIGFFKDTKIPKKILDKVDYERYIQSCVRGKLEMFYGTKGMNMEEVLNEHASLFSFYTDYTDEVIEAIKK